MIKLDIDEKGVNELYKGYAESIQNYKNLIKQYNCLVKKHNHLFNQYNSLIKKHVKLKKISNIEKLKNKLELIEYNYNQVIKQ